MDISIHTHTHKKCNNNIHSSGYSRRNVAKNVQYITVNRKHSECQGRLNSVFQFSIHSCLSWEIFLSFFYLFFGVLDAHQKIELVLLIPFLYFAVTDFICENEIRLMRILSIEKGKIIALKFILNIKL